MNQFRAIHLFAAFFLVTTVGCSKAADAVDRSSSASPAAVAAPASSAETPSGVGGSAGISNDTPGLTSAVKERALVVTSEMHLITSDVIGANARIRSEVERVGGYVADGRENASNDSKSAAVILRVPAHAAGGVKSFLRGLGEVTSQTDKVEDVTEAHADLEARLQNARAQERRVIDIMGRRAGTIAEVLEAERELSRVRETIERFEAQKRTMDGKIALATITVHLDGPIALRKDAPEAWRTPRESIANAFHSGLRGAAAVAVYGAMLFAATAPVLLPLALVLGVTISLVRRSRRQRERLLMLAAEGLSSTGGYRAGSVG